MKVKSESEVTQLCPTPSDPMDCTLPGSSVHGICQARVLEWGAIAFSELNNIMVINLYICDESYKLFQVFIDRDIVVGRLKVHGSILNTQSCPLIVSHIMSIYVCIYIYIFCWIRYIIYMWCQIYCTKKCFLFCFYFHQVRNNSNQILFFTILSNSQNTVQHFKNFMPYIWFSHGFPSFSIEVISILYMQFYFLSKFILSCVFICPLIPPALFILIYQDCISFSLDN